LNLGYYNVGSDSCLVSSYYVIKRINGPFFFVSKEVSDLGIDVGVDWVLIYLNSDGLPNLIRSYVLRYVVG